MKKVIALLLAVGMVLALAACSGETPKETQKDAQPTQTQPVNSGTEAYDPNFAPEFEMKTSAENTIVTVGTINKDLYQTPVLVTSFGQSTDAAMLDTVMKRIGVDYRYNAKATGSDIGNAKTVIICVGASTKGLGNAGISEADETARVKAFMETVKEKKTEIIMVHIGGSTRRGVLSDLYADLVLEQCSYIVLKEDANFDYKFTKYAEENNLPITLIYDNKSTVSVFSDLFGK